MLRRTLPAEDASRDERFAVGYRRANWPAHETGPDLNCRTWLCRRRAQHRPIHIVCPSRWLAACARRSTLMADWPITVIPNPIDINVWEPCEQAQALALLGIQADGPLVLFGAMGGSADPSKGADLLLEALQRLRGQLPSTLLAQLELVVFGQSRPAQPVDIYCSIIICLLGSCCAYIIDVSGYSQ